LRAPRPSIVLAVVLGAVGALPTLLGVSVGAHHSIAAVYDSSKKVTLRGVVRAFRFVDPHPWVELDRQDDAGRAQPWRLELDNRFELVQVGMTSDSLKPGDELVVVGSPSRQDQSSLYVRKLDRPADGLSYEQVGASPKFKGPRR